MQPNHTLHQALAKARAGDRERKVPKNRSKRRLTALLIDMSGSINAAPESFAQFLKIEDR